MEVEAPLFCSAMNASITGAWSKPRAKLSLNATAPTVPPNSAAANALRKAEQEDANDEAGPSRSSDKSGKRKSKSARSDSTKRGKTAKAAGAKAIADEYEAPATRLRDIGGAAPAIEKALELIAMPLCHPEIYRHTGVTPPRGVLFHGPPGCGKTMMAGALAGVRISY